jgi:hypothetical protein
MAIKRIPSERLTGSEKFKNGGSKSFSVLEFWQYGFSTLNSNVIRGVLAEFIVENALKDTAEINLRNPWGDYDIVTNEGIKVEVKCCSYLQDWDQKELSRIVFTGLKARKLYWNPAVSEKVADEKGYKADIYIFALLKHRDPETLDILNLEQWCFYILTRSQLKEASDNGNSISLVRLKKNHIKPVHFTNIKRTIKEITGN